MGRRRELLDRQGLYRELTDIMGAMKNMAQAETHKLRRRREQQAACLADVTRVAERVARAAGVPAAGGVTVLLAIGSERGFCGGYNEAVARALEDPPLSGRGPLIVMGSRLAVLLADRRPPDAVVPGPVSEKQVAGCLDAALEAFHALQQRHPEPLTLVAVSLDADGVRQTRLFPLPVAPVADAEAFRHSAPLPQLSEEIGNHYLYHALLSVLYTALHTENHRRLMQMEGALQHMDELSQQLKGTIDRQRQEDIVEEIEVIFSAAGGLFRDGDAPPEA